MRLKELQLNAGETLLIQISADGLTATVVLKNGDFSGTARLKTKIEHDNATLLDECIACVKRLIDFQYLTRKP